MFCKNCGAEIDDNAVVCVNCGCSTTPETPAQPVAASNGNDVLKTVIKVFMILGCISVGWAIIPLAWCIPLTVHVFKKLEADEPIDTVVKVCSLLFVNLVAGICLLCLKDQPAAQN